ncbi:MAG: hypothetical protein H2184_15555 [Candidatus Galacturonibacter soehngenii]|nr:hypothetical protein [Candidatus Galacturonibacter soehngenii]
MILLKANDKLKVIFHKMIKTMGENVQWNELFIINNNDLILLGKVRSLFFNFDNKRTYSNIIDITVNEETAWEITENETLENAINMILYTFGKWGSIKGLKVEKDYDQLNHLLAYIFKEIGVEASLTKDNLRFFKEGIQMTYEEVIQMILDEKTPLEEKEAEEEEKETSISEEEDEEYRLGLWHKVIWNSINLTFVKEELTMEDKAKARLGNQFYMVNYKCPTCQSKLHMVVYPKGQEFRIETDEGGVYLARAYTCSACNRFYTPKPKQLLAEGDVFQLSFEDDKVAYEDYQELLGKKGQRISNSNFNQYESEYLKQGEEETGEELESLYELEQYEALTQEELNALLEKLESGFYPQEIVDKYKEVIEREIQKRQVRQEKEEKKLDLERSQVIESKTNFVEREKEDKETKKIHPFTKNATKTTNHLESDKKEETPYLQEAPTKQKDTFSLSMEAFFHFKELVKKGDRSDIAFELKKLPKLQLQELRDRIPLIEDMEEEKKVSAIQLIDERLDEEAEEEIRKKVSECKDKSFSQVEKILEEITKTKRKEDINSPIIDSLKKVLEKKAKSELENLVSKAPKDLSKRQYEQLKDKMKEYHNIDTRLYEKLLEEKLDEAQKQEISSMMKRLNPRNRKAYQKAYEQLQELHFEERNVAPTLEKLKQKIYDADLSAIQDICKEPADLTFEEGIQAYEQILLGEYLPELKEDMLGQIDKRLTKLKSDECEQLVNKLIKELGDYLNLDSRMYFYNVRKMLRGKHEDEETIIIQNAINSYAKGIEKYEYPILICDTSYASNGESGFILTPNHIFYHSLLNGGKIDIMRIEKVFTHNGMLKRGIYVETVSNTIKIANSLKIKDLKPVGEVLNNFVMYLKEKPESRNVSYLAKEEHKVKCCYRCGFVYSHGNICPKCGSKMND